MTCSAIKLIYHFELGTLYLYRISNHAGYFCGWWSLVLSCGNKCASMTTNAVARVRIIANAGSTEYVI